MCVCVCVCVCVLGGTIVHWNPKSAPISEAGVRRSTASVAEFTTKRALGGLFETKEGQQILENVKCHFIRNSGSEKVLMDSP